MKLILLAAAAAIAVPATAQTTTTAEPMSPTSQTGAPTSDPSTGADPSASMPQTGAPMGGAAMGEPAPGGTTPTDPSMQSQPTQTTGDSMGGGTGAMAGDPSMADPAGGYQPSASGSSGPAQPGQTVRFQQPQSPDQAYPAPAAMSSYPICKAGQYDNCMQRSDARGSRARARRRR